jgi:hypothetical protein
MSYWDVDAQTRIMENSGGNFYFGDYLHTPIWIFTDVDLGDTIPIVVDGEGDHNFNVSGESIFDIPGFGPVEVWQLEDLTITGGIAFYEKSTGILLSGYFPYSGGMYSYSFEYISTNALFNKIISDHDLRVNLDVPTFCEVTNTYIINATVTNTGINDETDIDLFLYLDDILVDSINIANLPSGTSETINYIWTPIYYGEYNFTAYAPPVIGETFTTDNIRIEIIPIHRLILFNSMYLNYSFTLLSNTYPLKYSYSYISETLFHTDYVFYVDSSPQIGYWDVNTQTRIMTNSYGGIAFGSGTHTPIWIFTDISMNDIVPIAVDAEGDHNFEVTGELIYNFSGLGPLEVWILEDLTLPGGIAWYEKSTGILLNGTFLYYGGLYNYTFNLIDTNALSKSLNIIIPHSSSSWEAGTSHSIHWSSIGYIPTIKIELYKDNAFVAQITSGTINDGEYTWQIPSNLVASTQYQIKITDVSDPLIYIFSSYFEITQPLPGEIPLILIITVSAVGGGAIIAVVIVYQLLKRRKIKD